MNLKTKYLGLELNNPLVISACSMTREIDKVKHFEELGASAVVLPSLFEEEISWVGERAESTKGISGERITVEQKWGRAHSNRHFKKIII